MISRGRFGTCRRCVILNLAAVAISAGGLIWSMESSVFQLEPLWIGLLAVSGSLLALHLLYRQVRSAGRSRSET
ncbi:MAG: hypothetical protein L3K14_04290 [Thermoplasmata archaeon]|nr:hypothetical protein [Thermoplasmata archaeon]